MKAYDLRMRSLGAILCELVASTIKGYGVNV